MIRPLATLLALITLSVTGPLVAQSPEPVEAPEVVDTPDGDTAADNAAADANANAAAADPAVSDSETDADPTATEAAADPATATEPTTPEAASPPRPVSRVAVVLVGDPDPARRSAAEALDRELAELGLQRLEDSAMRAALLGQAAPDDGLERLHASRRRLLFEEDLAPTLLELGRRLRVDVLVVVRAVEPARVAVFDVAAAAFYEDEPLLAPSADAARFVRRAARASERRRTRPAEVARAESASPTEPLGDTIPPARRWLKQNWAYLVGGALLVAVVVGFVWRGRRNDEAPPPLLRFRPGLED